MSTTTPTRPRLAALIGLVLAAVIAVIEIVLAVPQYADEPASPTITIVLAAVTLIGVVFAWRGAGWARIVVIVTRLLASLLGVPAFFVPGIPAEWVALAAGGILLAVLVTVLILVGSGSRR